MRQEHERLHDIILAISKIETAQKRGREAFDTDEMVRVWMKYHRQIIGEAPRSLDPEFCRSCPSVPREKIIGLRDILVHVYGSVMDKRIWEIVENHVRDLKRAILSVIDSNAPQN